MPQDQSASDAYVIFEDDLPDGGCLCHCQNCGKELILKLTPLGNCKNCKAKLHYPPGAEW